MKQHPAQTYWLWRKVKENEATYIDLQLKLDNTVYNSENLVVYDKVIGDGFSTPGGLQSTKVSMSG